MPTRGPFIAAIVIAFSFANPVSAQVDPGSQSYNDLVLRGESGGNQHATTQLGSATGTYQFTAATLKGLGYISSLPEGGVPAGDGEWQGVSWTGQDGVRSRQDFMDNMYAQDQALARLTEQNLVSISSNIGGTANGIPVTEGGAAYAAHMMGAGGFNQWASCGYQPECLDPSQAAANNMTLEEYQAHLMNRMAEGAEVDPSNITQEGGYEGEDLPPAALMPWTAEIGARVNMVSGG